MWCAHYLHFSIVMIICGQCLSFCCRIGEPGHSCNESKGSFPKIFGHCGGSRAAYFHTIMLEVMQINYLSFRYWFSPLSCSFSLRMISLHLFATRTGTAWYCLWHEWPFFTGLYYLVQATMSIGFGFPTEVCIHICMYVYMCKHTRAYIRTYVCIYIKTHTHTHTHIHVYILSNIYRRTCAIEWNKTSLVFHFLPRDIGSATKIISRARREGGEEVVLRLKSPRL